MVAPPRKRRSRTSPTPGDRKAKRESDLGRRWRQVADRAARLKANVVYTVSVTRLRNKEGHLLTHRATKVVFASFSDKAAVDRLAEASQAERVRDELKTMMASPIWRDSELAGYSIHLKGSDIPHAEVRLHTTAIDLEQLPRDCLAAFNDDPISGVQGAA